MTEKFTAIMIKFRDGSVWEVDAEMVAKNRAAYYAKLDVDRGDEGDYDEAFKDEVEWVLKDDYEVIDWMKNSMDWEDLNAVRVEPEDDFDYADEFRNADASMV